VGVGGAGHSLCSNSLFDTFVRKPAACWTRKWGFVQPPFTRLSQKVMPGTATPTHMQLYSIYSCDEGIINIVF